MGRGHLQAPNERAHRTRRPRVALGAPLRRLLLRLARHVDARHHRRDPRVPHVRHQLGHLRDRRTLTRPQALPPRRLGAHHVRPKNERTFDRIRSTLTSRDAGRSRLAKKSPGVNGFRPRGRFTFAMTLAITPALASRAISSRANAPKNTLTRFGVLPQKSRAG